MQLSGKRTNGRTPELKRPLTVQQTIDVPSAQDQLKANHSHDNRLWVTVRILGKEMQALIDTGASTSFVSSEVANYYRQREKCSTSKVRTNIRLADGSIVKSNQGIHMPMTINNQEHKLKFLVMSRTCHSIILGMDALSIFKAQIDIAAKKVKFQQVQPTEEVQELNVTDSLSRAPLIREETDCAMFENIRCAWYTRKFQETSENKVENSDFRIQNNTLYRTLPSLSKIDEHRTWKICIPTSERNRILQEVHDNPEAGHLGIAKTYARAATNYYWPGMFRDVKKYVLKCEACHRHKFDQNKPLGNMLYSPIDLPWEQVSMDLLGPYPRSKNGNTYLFVIQDRFTKWVECQPLRKATAVPIIQALKEKIIYRFGTPKIFISDNGPQFISKLLRTAADELGIQIRYTPPYSAQNNCVERINRVLGPMIAQYIKEGQQEWDKYLPQFVFAINTSRHDTTGFSPAFLNFGREPVPPRSVKYDAEKHLLHEEENPAPVLADEVVKLSHFYDIVRLRLAEGFQRQSRPYNLRHRPFRPYVGQMVYKKEHHLSDASKHFSAKLAPKYSGPYRIQSILSPVIVYLQVPHQRAPVKVHVKDLKLPGGEN